MRASALLTALGLATFAANAGAQQVQSPTGLAKQDKATEGKTDVAKEGFAGAADRPADDKDVTDLSLSLGGLFMSGNSRNVALTGASKLRLRRDDWQFSAALAGNFARSGKKGTPVETTAENAQALVRGDYYFIPDASFFLQASARKDRFQGLEVRLNLDPGLAYYFLDDKKHRLWAEIGYDFQFDSRTEAAINDARDPSKPVAKQQFLADTKTRHSGRLFLGYENKLYKAVTFVTGLEYLQAFAQSDEAPTPIGAVAPAEVKAIDAYRINYDIGLKSNVAEHLAAATTFTLRYDHAPLPDVETTDTITAINLVYTF